MPLKPEQKQVIDDFQNQYFQIARLDKTRISLSEFMAKTQAKQIDFIKNWAIERHDKLTETQSNLTQQQQRVQTQKATFKKALQGWGHIV